MIEVINEFSLNVDGEIIVFEKGKKYFFNFIYNSETKNYVLALIVKGHVRYIEIKQEVIEYNLKL